MPLRFQERGHLIGHSGQLPGYIRSPSLLLKLNHYQCHLSFLVFQISDRLQ